MRLGYVDDKCACQTDEVSLPSSRAVISFTGANPPSVDSKARLVWTRHRIDLIKANIGQAYPFFQGHLKAGRKMYEAYTYEGRFRIESVELATKNEVLEFIKARKISKRKRPAASWMEKLEAQWCKVLLIRCPEEEQTGNPLEQ